MRARFIPEVDLSNRLYLVEYYNFNRLCDRKCAEAFERAQYTNVERKGSHGTNCKIS